MAERENKKSKEGFSYEWNVFNDIDPEFEKQLLDYYINPFNSSFFKNKFGLDAGCGNGRFLNIISKYGARMIGIDFSASVKTAYKNTKQINTVYIAQADLHMLPFKEGIFDFIYSIGVLHHLANAKNGFIALSKYLKPGGVFILWVYFPIQRHGINMLLYVVYSKFVNQLRHITTKMPYGLLLRISTLAAFFERYVFHLPYKIFRNFTILKRILSKMPFSYNANVKFKSLVGVWFDRLFVPVTHKIEKCEVETWFKAAKFKKYQLSDPWRGRAYGVK